MRGTACAGGGEGGGGGWGGDRLVWLTQLEGVRVTT